VELGRPLGAPGGRVLRVAYGPPTHILTWLYAEPVTGVITSAFSACNQRAIAKSSHTGLGAIALADAVAASGAVPGVWPLVWIDDRSWIDGRMVSSATARLADGYDRIVVLAPMPAGYGAVLGVEDDVAAMRAMASVVLLSPDQETTVAIGPHPYDPSRRSHAAAGGRNQGARMASEINAMW
jgi:predicted acylesterase/phospholipase RssA